MSKAVCDTQAHTPTSNGTPVRTCHLIHERTKGFGADTTKGHTHVVVSLRAVRKCERCGFTDTIAMRRTFQKGQRPAHATKVFQLRRTISAGCHDWVLEHKPKHVACRG